MRKKNIFDKIAEKAPGYREAAPDTTILHPAENNDREYLDYIERKHGTTPGLNGTPVVPEKQVN